LVVAGAGAVMVVVGTVLAVRARKSAGDVAASN